MRILQTVEFYHPAIGGAERVVQRVSEGLAARGHEVVVATSYDPRRETLMHNGVRIVPFQVSGNLARGLRGDVARYQDWFVHERFDVVMNYAAQAWPTDAALAVLQGVGGVKILATCGFSGMYGVRRLLYWRYFRRMPQWLRHYDALIYHSRVGADVTLGRRYGPAEQVIIPNGADGREFEGALPGFRSRYGIQSRYMLLHVGNHYRVKNHRDLLKVVHSLRDLDATLVMIGEDVGGPHGCWGRCAAAAARDPRIRVLRGLARADVVAAYREGDVFLLTSRFEAAPLVLVEAMAAGVPFVSYDVGNAADLAGGVVVSTTEEMANVVRSLLRDEDRHRKLGRAGREMQQKVLKWDLIVDKYQALYATLAERRVAAR